MYFPVQNKDTMDNTAQITASVTNCDDGISAELKLTPTYVLVSRYHCIVQLEKRYTSSAQGHYYSQNNEVSIEKQKKIPYYYRFTTYSQGNNHEYFFYLEINYG